MKHLNMKIHFYKYILEDNRTCLIIGYKNSENLITGICLEDNYNKFYIERLSMSWNESAFKSIAYEEFYNMCSEKSKSFLDELYSQICLI